MSFCFDSTTLIIDFSGVFYLKNIFLARPRFEPATARNTFQHKNTKPQPSVLGYAAS
jgi:hypothetical protein